MTAPAPWVCKLAPRSGAFDLPQLAAATRLRFPQALDVNRVDDPTLGPCVAVYLTVDPSPATVTAWKTDIAGWTVTHPTADETAATAAANADALRAKALTALTTNDAFLGTVAARRTNIASGKSTAQTGTAATVTSVAQAQTQIRSIWTVLVQVATALDDLNNDAESLTKQNNGVIRLLLGALDTTTGT